MASVLRLPKPLERGLYVIIVILAGFAVFRIVTRPEPRLPIGAANGVYVNAQGGTLDLRDGRLTAGAQSVGYIIEKDKQGPYVLPERELILQDDGSVRIGSHSDLMKSHMDRPEHPSRIEFWMGRGQGDDSPEDYVFERRPDPTPRPTNSPSRLAAASLAPPG